MAGKKLSEIVKRTLRRRAQEIANRLTPPPTEEEIWAARRRRLMAEGWREVRRS